MYRVLSFGGGVQSSTLLMLSERGMLPKLDCAIFADTGWEPTSVYEWIEWLQTQTSIPIHRVSAGNIRQDALRSSNDNARNKETGWLAISMPYFVKTPHGGGQLNRSCTRDYKITPIRQRIREVYPDAVQVGVEQWMGFSEDNRDSEVLLLHGLDPRTRA